MHRLPRLLAAALLAVLAACGSGGDADSELAIRFLHVAPDAPRVNFLIDGNALRSLVDYRSGTPFLFLTGGHYDIAVEAIVPVANETVFELPNEPLANGLEYTVLLTGRLADDDLETLRIVNPLSEVSGGHFRLQVVHAAPDAAAVDIYLTDADALLSASTPLYTLAYRDQAPRDELPAATLRLRVTPAGDPDTVLYDSGSLGFSALNDLLVVLAANTGTGTSPFSVVFNNRFTSTVVNDAASPAAIRVIHGVPDGPPLDVCADTELAVSGEEITCDGPLVADALAYATRSPYAELAAAVWSLVATDDTDPAANPQPVIPVTALALAAGQRTTLLYAGLLDGSAGIALTDDTRSVYTEGRLRLVNAAPAAGIVDVWLLEPGTALADANPTLSSLSLGAQTGHLSFAPQALTLVVTSPGTEEVLATTDLTLAAGDVATVVVFDAPRPDAESTGLPIGITVFDDGT